jgi:hypothetical protein
MNLPRGSRWLRHYDFSENIAEVNPVYPNVRLLGRNHPDLRFAKLCKLEGNLRRSDDGG